MIYRNKPTSAIIQFCETYGKKSNNSKYDPPEKSTNNDDSFQQQLANWRLQKCKLQIKTIKDKIKQRLQSKISDKQNCRLSLYSGSSQSQSSLWKNSKQNKNIKFSSKFQNAGNIVRGRKNENSNSKQLQKNVSNSIQYLLASQKQKYKKQNHKMVNAKQDIYFKRQTTQSSLLKQKTQKKSKNTLDSKGLIIAGKDFFKNYNEVFKVGTRKVYSKQNQNISRNLIRQFDACQTPTITKKQNQLYRQLSARQYILNRY